MKTRYFILATLAMALLAVSCQKTAVGGAQELEEAPEPIQLTTNLKVNSVSVTKAAVDAWAGQKLYIYALPTTGNDELHVKNVEVTAPASETSGELTLKKEDGTLYYYPANSSTYDFYGYYVGYPVDAEKITLQTDGNYKLHITLDGSQDVMLAKANKEEDTADKGIAPTNAYGAYSARKGVVPNLKFEHQLSRFVFRVAAGYSQGSGNVEIQKVSLSSKKEADLVVTGSDRRIVDPSNPDVFYLKNLDGTDFTPTVPKRQISTGTSFVFKDEDQIGESIMVIPDENHNMTITLKQKDSQSSTTYLADEFTITETLVPGDVVDEDGNNCEYQNFLPGYQYNVNIVVYGRQQVDVKVTLSPWFEAGNIIIDDDKDWGDEPKLGLKAKKGESDYYLYFYDKPIVAKTESSPGTEVRVWDQTTNKMVPAAAGTYELYAVVQESIKFVKLEQEGEGETLKTVVTGLYATDPAIQTTE